MSTPEPSARRILKLATPFLIAVVVLGGGIAAVELFKDSTFDLHGTLTITGGRCTSPGFSDIQAGRQVRIVNRGGEVLAVGTLAADSEPCRWRFIARDVPAGAGMYGVEAGNDARGAFWGPEDQARAGVSLTIG